MCDGIFFTGFVPRSMEISIVRGFFSLYKRAKTERRRRMLETWVISPYYSRVIFTLSVSIYSLAASNNDNTTYFFICHWINRKNLRPHFSICFHLKFIKIRFPDARLPVARILKMRAHCWERFWSKREKEKASVFQVRIIHLSNITITSPESKTSILTRMDIFNGVRTPWPN